MTVIQVIYCIFICFLVKKSKNKKQDVQAKIPIVQSNKKQSKKGNKQLKKKLVDAKKRTPTAFGSSAFSQQHISSIPIFIFWIKLNTDFLNLRHDDMHYYF